MILFTLLTLILAVSNKHCFLWFFSDQCNGMLPRNIDKPESELSPESRIPHTQNMKGSTQAEVVIHMGYHHPVRRC